MVYKEEVRDLFTVPQGYMLAYCISADFNLFSEIEKQFCERYDMENRLFADYGSDFDGVGMALEIDNVYNLVTKRYAHNKPTYENLAMTLENMKDSMICEVLDKEDYNDFMTDWKPCKKDLAGAKKRGMFK